MGGLGEGGVRERSSTIVTSKYGTSTGIHKTDTEQIRAKGGGGVKSKCRGMDGGGGGVR